jgi:diguanylate cyclase (GGDEF)-like protein
VHTAFFAKQRGCIEVEGVLTTERSAEGTITRAICRDFTERKRAEEALHAANEALTKLAVTDALTGLANRRVLDGRLDEAWSRARRHATPLSLVMLDVDHFKLYNDRYGHVQGDECLRRVAQCVRNSVRRAGELAARFGGEEFAVLLPGSELADAVRVAELLRSKIEALNLPHEGSPRKFVSTSLGVASLVATMQGPADLVSAADQALYRAKEQGRNRVVG